MLQRSLRGIWALLPLLLLLARAPTAPPALATTVVAAAPPITNPFVTQPNVLTARITQSALVAISASTLASAGWAVDQIAAANVHLWNGPTEVPISITGGTGTTLSDTTIRFIGHANTSRFTRETVYWLTYDSTPGLRGALALAPGDPLRWDAQNLYNARYAGPTGDRWFGREVQAAQTVTAMLTLPSAVPAGTPLQLGLVGMERRAHTLQVSANGQALGSLAWSDAAVPLLGQPQAATVTLTLPVALPAGLTRFDLTLTSTGLPSDAALIQSLTLPTIRPAYSATPITPVVAAHASLDLRTGPAPGVTGADYLIITHTQFRAALAPLVAVKQAQGQRVAVVDVQDAYDAWSFGARDPEAIRSLIRTAAATWQPAPTAVLLVGAGTVRMRPLAGEGDTTFIPPYLVDADPWIGEIPCDTCYTRLDADDPLDDPLPDLAIGRLPVRTPEEAAIVVAKTVTALTAPPGGMWQHQALLLADNDREADGTPDKTSGFAAMAATVTAQLPTPWQTTTVQYAPDQPASTSSYPDGRTARCAFFRALDGSASDPHCPTTTSDPGAALLVYVGHASPWQWGTTTLDGDPPYLYSLYDADRLRNGGRLPILLALSCLSGSFANAELPTTDERLLLHAGGGTLASLSSAGLVVDTGQAALAHGVLPVLTAGGTLGAAHLAGLRAVIAGGSGTSLAWSYQLLGDPQISFPLAHGSTIYLPVVAR